MWKKGLYGLITLLIILILLVQFPSLFIQKNSTYKCFTIYSNSPIDINTGAKKTLDSISLTIEKNHFYRADDHYHLYFVQGTFYERLLGLFGMKNIASSKYFTHIYIAEPDFEKGKLKKSEDAYEWLNLVQIISHEAVHSQMYADYSTLGFMDTPHWINEGYAEYISYQGIRQGENYRRSNLLETLYNTNGNWVQTEHGAMTPRLYMRDRLVMEYLLDKKGKTILEVIQDEALNVEEIFEEIKSIERLD